jgi:hypothetical protein
VTILNAVFEPKFCGYSYGSRPGRSQHDALDALHEGIVRRKINWILDCDIEGFFDNLSHGRLMDFIEERVTDKRMLRLIRKWLQVGWMEDGKRHAGTKGTPQGAVISPLLANIFLDAVMDMWASAWRRAEAKGERRGMAGKRDTWVHELPCDTGKYEGAARVLHPNRPTMAMGDTQAQSTSSASLDLGTILPTATAVVAAPAPRSSIPQCSF